ncbi:MAG: hypothetical protein KJZ84_06790 [Bryobacteraceae bacterium]|nr:hypothetical protein [Bryobacteraceae bacterium]
MNQFEDQLRDALRRVPPPAGFVERTLARAAQEQRAPRRAIRFPRYVAALAASLALVFGGLRYQEYRQGQQAKEQLMTALRITGSQLHQVQQKVAPAGPER